MEGIVDGAGRVANASVIAKKGQKATVSSEVTASTGRSRHRHRSRKRRSRTGNHPSRPTQRMESSQQDHQQKPVLKKVASMEDLIDLSDDPVPTPALARAVSDKQTTKHPAEALLEKGKAPKGRVRAPGKGRRRRRGNFVEKKK